MSDQGKDQKRRWLQFSLRSLLILVTVVIGLLVALRFYLATYDEQRETMTLIERLGGRYQAKPGGPAWLRWVLGEERLRNITAVDLADCDQPDRYLGRIARLPHIKHLIVGGPRFTDRECRGLKDLRQLEILVLDTTEVTEGGLAELREALPKLLVRRSTRRAIAALGWEERVLGRAHKPKHPALRRFAQSFGAGHFQDVHRAYLMGDVESDDLVVLLKHFSKLERLVMSRCFPRDSTSEIALRHIPELENLKTLHLDGANLTDSDLRRLDRLTQLKTLELYDFPITDAGLAELKRFSNLKQLGLGVSQFADRGAPHITDAGLAHLSELKGLTFLRLRQTRVGDDGLAHLNALSALQQLDLSHTAVGDAGVAHLTNLPLRWLRLTGTKVTDAGLAHLASIKSLDTLYLDNNPNITDAGLEHLAPLGKLGFVELTGTRVTKSGLARLQKILPNVSPGWKTPKPK